MSKATLFTHGKGQTVFLPKEVQFAQSVTEVEAVRQGGSIVLTPKPEPAAPSADEGKKPTLLDMVSKRSRRAGIDLADIDLESVLPPRGYWEPRPAESPDAAD